LPRLSRSDWNGHWSICLQTNQTDLLCVDVAGYKIINVYKSPRSRLTPTAILKFPHPSLYVGDFNYQRVDWGYSKTSPDGEGLDCWATVNNLWLLYDAKEAAIFGRWNVGTNPDLAFASVGQDNRLLDRRVLGKFPRSQHLPSLITLPKLKVPAYSDLVKKWSFRKSDWKRFCLLTGESVERLPPSDTTQQTSRRHTKNFARAYYPRPNNVSHMGVARTMCHAETKSGRPSITPSREPRWGLTLIEPLCPYFRESNRRSRSDGRSCQFHRLLAL